MGLMDSASEFTGPMNAGNPIEFTILELAELVIELTGSKSHIVKKDLPGDDPKQRRPDISIAKHNIGWEPKVELREGLEKNNRIF